jgi:hypothetical protein
MKVLMVMQHVNFFRNLDTVVRELHARGHEIALLHGTRLDDPQMRARVERKRSTKKMVFMGRGLQSLQSDVCGVQVGFRPEPTEPWQQILKLGRGVMNRGIYMRKWHPSPERVTEGLEKELPADLQRRVRSPLWKTVLSRRVALQAWRLVELASPPSQTVVEALKAVAPDLVLVSPSIWPKNPIETDYLRAARALRIPSIGYVNSWDNLTSKGTVHVPPDVFVVWNEPLAEEAVELHDVPVGAVRITGAPHLDRFFEMTPAASRESVAARMGCPDAAPYVVFLCSSRTLMTDETPLVTTLAEALSRRFAGKPPTLVVRPHPTNAEPWDRYTHPGVVVYPKHGDQADTAESWQAYFDQLKLAACVIGLNTTAFLEAVVADCPCLTIVSDEYYGAQGRTGHFRHLLKGDFLEVSRDADDAAGRVARILEGADDKRDGRRGFVRWFIRPCGMEQSASVVVADLIESMLGPGEASAARIGRRALVPGLTLASEGIGR